MPHSCGMPVWRCRIGPEAYCRFGMILMSAIGHQRPDSVISLIRHYLPTMSALSNCPAGTRKGGPASVTQMTLHNNDEIFASESQTMRLSVSRSTERDNFRG